VHSLAIALRQQSELECMASVSSRGDQSLEPGGDLTLRRQTELEEACGSVAHAPREIIVHFRYHDTATSRCSPASGADSIARGPQGGIRYAPT